MSPMAMPLVLCALFIHFSKCVFCLFVGAGTLGTPWVLLGSLGMLLGCGRASWNALGVLLELLGVLLGLLGSSWEALGRLNQRVD